MPSGQHFAPGERSPAPPYSGHAGQDRAVEDQPLHAIRMSGGVQQGHRGSFREADQRGRRAADGVQYRCDVVGSAIQIMRPVPRIAQSDARPVELDQSPDRTQALIETEQWRELPIDLQVGDEALGAPCVSGLWNRSQVPIAAGSKASALPPPFRRAMRRRTPRVVGRDCPETGREEIGFAASNTGSHGSFGALGGK